MWAGHCYLTMEPLSYVILPPIKENEDLLKFLKSTKKIAKFVLTVKTNMKKKRFQHKS